MTISTEAATFAKEVVAKVAPCGPARARSLLFALGALAEWGRGVGSPLSPAVLLAEASIERHVAVAMSGASATSARTRRANLRFVARALHLPLVATPVPIARDGPARPYSHAETEAYFALAKAQPPTRRRMVEAILCLGLGAGLDGGDLRHVCGHDIKAVPGGIVVTVSGIRPRTVPVLSRYEELAQDVSAYFSERYVAGGRVPSRRNVTSTVLSRISGGEDLPALKVARLRSTWLVEQLGRLGLHALLQAAGVSSSQRLGELASWLGPVDESELVATLVGAS